MQASDHATVELRRPVKLNCRVLRLLILIAAVSAIVDARATAAAPSQMVDQIQRAVAAFKGVMGVAARNLATGEEVVLNADLRFPTASTIKTAVMVEAYHQAADGKLPLDTLVTLRDADKVGGSGVLNGFRDGAALRVADLIHLMIVVSDNTATNLLVNRLGAARIDDRLVCARHRRARVTDGLRTLHAVAGGP
jgi:beta-lactamase class A